ncbi:hypothetical protein [Brachybacterium paraconglomeratum]|uniref:hypothetical protein n=1 Tax=Brachybacterium paraconglomeratum TaxID=173362 RepID=UPI003F7C925A
MLFADFIKRLMPIAQSAPEFRDHFPPASWKQLFDLGTEAGDGLLVFEVDDLLLAELGGGRVEDVVVPFVRALNQEFAGDRAPREEEPQAAARFEQDAPSAPRVAASPGPAASSESAVPVEPAAARAGEQTSQRPAAGAVPWAAAPSPETPSAMPAPSSEPVPAEPSWSFPEYDYSREDVDPVPNVEVSSVDGGTALRYSWPDPGDQELFRVVVSDHEPPFSPDDAADVGTSETALLRDATEPATAVRFVTVWGYEVLDHGARELGQPRKVAEGTYVQPVQEWTIEHDREAGMVFSSWRRPVYPSHVTGRVRVAKLPVGEPIGRHLRGQNWLRSSLQIPNSEQGFQDGALRPGETHTYVAGLEVQIEGRTLVSTPKHLQIVPEAEPDRIVDLQVESVTRDRQEQLRLTWTQRKGTQVQFCRSTTPARPEAVSRGRITAAQMADAGLPAEQLIRNIPSPTGEVSEDGRERWVLEGLDWPRGSAWDTLHLTPITRLNQDEVLIGAPTQLRRAGRIEEVRVVQRMNWQLVTFTWPGEALAVELRVGFPDSEPDLSTPAHAVVEKAAYERSGGFRLDHGLPPQGCRLFLNAVTHFQGRRISSEPTVAAVDPLWGYHYTVEWGVGSTGGGGNLLQRAAARRRKNVAQIEIDAVLGTVPEHEAPTFVLLHRPDRLPMHSGDGTRVTVFSERPDGQVPAQPHDGVPAPVSGRRELWFDEEDMGPGWYRLMVDARPAATVRVDERRTALERYALADPPLTQLDRRG